MSSNELYRLFVEATGEALVAVALPEGRFTFLNQAFLAMTGFAREEIEGESVSVLNTLPGDESARERSIGLEMLQVAGYYNDVALPTRDRQTRYVTVKVSHAQLDGRTIALAVISDDTERLLLVRDLTTKHQSLETAYVELEKIHTELKGAQEQMFQASKLVALGELAAGMSHELNQPLTGIRGFAQEIEDILKSTPKPKKSEVRKLCSHIIVNSDKMANLLSHLRDFARKGREGTNLNDAPEPTSVYDAATNVQTLLKRQLAKSEVQFEAIGLTPELVAMARMHPLEQVFINLITNSRDAIVEHRHANPSIKGRILLAANIENNEVVVRVTDNGGGIPDKVRDRIFDPFFSTKDPGKGMGLGLSICFSIIHKFGGELRLESTSSSGTTFALRLPLVASAPQKRSA